MFCYISKNWQGQPLIDIETVINLINSTTTKTVIIIINTVEKTLQIHHCRCKIWHSNSFILL